MRGIQQVLAWTIPIVCAVVAYRLHASGDDRFSTFFVVIAVWSFVNAVRGVPRLAKRDDLLGPPMDNPNRELVAQLAIGFVLFAWAVVWVAQVHPAKAALGISAALGAGGVAIWLLLRGPLMWRRVGRDLGLDYYPGGPDDPALCHGTLEGRSVTVAPSASGTLFRVRVTGEVDEAPGAVVDLDQWLFGLRAGPDARLRRLDELGGDDATYLLVQGNREQAVRTVRQLVSSE